MISQRFDHIYQFYSCIPVIFSLVSPEITHPTHNITENPIILEDFHETIECVATGLPVPEVYWIKSTNISERIGTSSIEITSVLLTEPINVFYCIAVNSLGMDVVSVTYQISVENALDNVQEKLDNSTSITPEEAATILESILSSIQTSSEIEVLTTSVGLIEQVVDQVNGTFSNETTQIITATLDTVINSTDSLEKPKTVSLLSLLGKHLSATIFLFFTYRGVLIFCVFYLFYKIVFVRAFAKAPRATIRHFPLSLNTFSV